MDISVIIPVFNAALYLNQCLSSISRSSAEIEVICIDDGSTDESPEILQSVADKDDRFMVVSKQNEGYGATLNRGLSIACGRYIAIIEPDDYLEGDMFSTLLALAEKSSYPDIVKSAYWSVSEAGDRKAHCSYWKRVKPVEQPFCIGQAPLLLRFHPSIWSAIYRKEFLDEKKIAFVEAPGAGWVDNPFLMRTMLEAKSIVYTDESFYCYRDDRTGSSTASINDYRIPFDRWNEMTDILEASDVHNERITEIHTYRAFFYLQAAKKAANFNERAWENKATAMMSRLDADVVARSPFISPGNKRLYEDLTGDRLDNVGSMPYYRMLAKEAFWKIRQNGVVYLLSRMRRG